MTRVRAVLDDLSYQPVPLKYLHFERQGATGPIRIELLTGPIDTAVADMVRVKDFRIRPRKAIELHAYLTNEALDVELDPVEVPVDGTTVLVPNSFSFLLMKLHAFRDRMDQEREDEDRQLGRHHALDVYRVIAMLTEEEAAFVRSRCAARRDAQPVQAAAQVVAKYFATPNSLGVLRLREHPLAGDHLQIDPFVGMLGDLFGLGPP